MRNLILAMAAALTPVVAAAQENTTTTFPTGDQRIHFACRVKPEDSPKKGRACLVRGRVCANFSNLGGAPTPIVCPGGIREDDNRFSFYCPGDDVVYQYRVRGAFSYMPSTGAIDMQVYNDESPAGPVLTFDDFESFTGEPATFRSAFLGDDGRKLNGFCRVGFEQESDEE